VYYELGIAHTLGKPVILLTQNLEDIPFDIRDQRIVKYSLEYSEIDKFKEALLRSIESIKEEQKPPQVKSVIEP